MKAVNNAGVITFYQSVPNSFRSSTGLHLNVKGWSNNEMKDNGLFDVIIDDNYDSRIHDLVCLSTSFCWFVSMLSNNILW
jgi:hypothetical protein